MSIATEFSTLKSNLEARSAGCTKYLQNPLNVSLVRDSLGKAGLESIDDVVEFYGICGGIKIVPDEVVEKFWLFSSYYPLDFETALEVYSLNSRDSRWQSGNFPIFANGGGDFYSVVTPRDAEFCGAVSGFILGEPEQFVEFSSLENMLSVINKCFDDGICWVDAEGVVETDFSRAARIAMQMNSALPYYN